MEIEMQKVINSVASAESPPFVPSKRLPDWASLELSPSVESCGCGLGPSPRGLTPRGSLECNLEIPAFPGE